MSLQNLHRLRMAQINTAPPVAATYEPEMQAWINKNIQLGNYLPNAARLAVANQHIIDEKANGVFQEKDVYFIFKWNDLQCADASLVCFKRLVEAELKTIDTDLPVYTLDGWTNEDNGNGFKGYIDTKYNLSTDAVKLQVGDASRGFAVTKTRTAGATLISGAINLGASNSAMETIGVWYNQSDNILASTAGATTGATISSYGMGIITQYRDDLTTTRFYNQQKVKTTTTLNSGTLHNGNLILLGTRHIGAIGGFAISNVGLGAAFWGSAFTEAQDTQMRTDLETYFTNIDLVQ